MAFFTLIVAIFALSLCVIVHYEMLITMGRYFKKPQLLSYRLNILLGALCALLSHIFHIWIFTLTYWFILSVDGRFGDISGEPITGLRDYVYFSFVIYTTLGFGDMVPHDWVRFIVGTEAITGLVMIAWTASFLFLEFQKQWDKGSHT